MPVTTRDRLIPGAHSPQLVTRLVELVARGIRSARALQEALAVDARTVRAYLRAARWLGMLEDDGELWLTPLGLEYAYAGSEQPEVYGRAVRAVPMVAELMADRDPGLPPRDAVEAAIARHDPDLADSTIRRRASAVRSLIEPAFAQQAPGARARQMDLPLGLVTPRARKPALSLEGGLEHNPDLYRFLLARLLDHGELTLGQLRALLDQAGVHEAPIGGYVDMALARGDASRRDDRLVVTAGAIAHRDLANSTPSVILSEPGYRAWLADLLTADRDAHARIRRSQKGARYRPWDRRLFGRAALPDTLVVDLERVLMDRSLDTFPLRGEAGAEPVAVDAPFLDVQDTRGLAIALPPTLIALTGGLGPVNQALERARRGLSTVGPPDLAHRAAVVHGGLLHPGETLPRSVPDLRTLRLRLLQHAPYPALLAALLLVHRLEGGGVDVVEERGRWVVEVRRRPVGEVLHTLDGFAVRRGWLASRRPRGRVGADRLLDVLEHLGIAVRVAGRALLDEAFFAALRREAEEIEVCERLQPLAEALADHLHQLPAVEQGRHP